jgi:hypothetical protein
VVGNNRDLTVVFKGDSSDLTRAAGDSEKALGHVGDAASGHGGLLSKLTPVIDPISLITQGLGFLTGAVSDFAQVAIDGNKSVAALDGVIKNVTGDTQGQIDKQEAWLTQLSGTVGIIDDNLRPAYGRLVAATGNVDTARDDLKTALDVAAGTGKDFGSVTDAFVKAANGNEGALSRLGINIHDKVTGNLLPLPEVIKNLQDKYGGLAATVADEDPLTKMSTAWHNIQEQMGQFVIPIFAFFADVMTKDVMPALQGFHDWIQTNWPKIEAIMKPSVDRLSASLDNLDTALGKHADPKGNAAGAGFWWKVASDMALDLRNKLDDLSHWVNALKDAVDAAKDAWKWFHDTIIVTFDDIKDRIQRVGKFIGDIADGFHTSWVAAINAVVRAWNDTLGKMKIPGTNFGFPTLPTIPGTTAVMPSASASSSPVTGSVININLPSGTDGHAIVAALRTYNVRVGGLDLAKNATR